MSEDQQPQSPKPSSILKFWQELRRRHVVRVAITYAVVAWLIIQIASSTFGWFDIPVWAYRFVVFMVILGFPIAVIVAWAFELTPEGIKTSKTARVEHPEAHKDVTHAKKRHWFSLGLAAAVPTLIFGILAVFFYVRSGSLESELASTEQVAVEENDRSIAVLPLENLSPDPENAYFASGVHEDIRTNLSYIKSFKVIATTSVMRYEDTEMSQIEIGEELGVRYLLEGSVRRAGKRIKVSVQLIDTDGGEQLWAEDYDRELSVEKVFEIQAEISQKIAGALRTELSPEETEQLEKLPTQNMAALEAYFKGNDIKNSIAGETISSTKKIVEHFQEAIIHDPEFALAHAALGRAIITHARIAGTSRVQNNAEAERHILEALELDGNSSKVYSALGFLRRGQRDFEQAKIAFEKAIILNPNNADTYISYGFMVRNTDPLKASSFYRKAYELDPNSDTAKSRLAAALGLSGEFEDSLDLLKSMAANHPESTSIQSDLGVSYAQHFGKFDEAILAFGKGYSLNPNLATFLGRISDAYMSLGDFDMGVRWLDRQIELAQDPGLKSRFVIRKSEWIGDDLTREMNAQERLEANPENRPALISLSELYIASGQAEKAYSRCKRAYPSLFEPMAGIDGFDLGQVKTVARVLMVIGETVQAQYLLEEALDRVRTFAPNWFNILTEADLQAIAGDDSKALDAIRRCLDAGGSPYDVMGQDELKHFETDLEYQAMAEKRKEELAVQLKHVREMEANGELAPWPEEYLNR